MELKDIKLVSEGKRLNKYNLHYINKDNKEKIYEIVTRNKINTQKDLGKNTAGVVIVAYSKDRSKMLLLKEFRPAINKFIINTVSGMIDENETIEECIKRELFEETGITEDKLKINRILAPSYSAVGMTDEKVSLAYVEVDINELELTDINTSPNEVIKPMFVTREYAKKLLNNYEFASKTQIIVDTWINGI